MSHRLPERAESREAILALLVHVAFSDGVVQDEELAFLRGIFVGHPPDLRAWMEQSAQQPLDVAAIAAALPNDDDRWAALRFAAAMAWTDQELASHEKALLVEVAADLDLPRDAVERVLDELVGRPRGPVPADAVQAALQRIDLEEVEVVAGPPKARQGAAPKFSGSERSLLGGPGAEDVRSETGNAGGKPQTSRQGEEDLLSLVPVGWHPVAVLRLDGTERIALFAEGFVAAFREGTELVRWEAVIAYTRVPVFGAAVRVETNEDDFTLTDVRLRSFATLLDRVYRG